MARPHASEVVAAGNNFNQLVPCAGLLQELHVLLGSKVPFYLDSITTLFVLSSDTAAKRSAWLMRRVTVLEEGVTQGYIEPVHIPEYNMAADPFTKYLVYAVWLRHMHYVLNFKGVVPDREKQVSVGHAAKRGCDTAISN